MDERQLLLNDIDKEEQEALESAKFFEGKITDWIARHKDGLKGYEFKKALAEKRLKEIQDSKDRARKDPQPYLALALKNEERVKRGDMRYLKGTISLPTDVAHSLELKAPLWTKMVRAKTIKTGTDAGKAFVNDFFKQIFYNGLLYKEGLRHVTDEEIMSLLSK